MDPNPSPVPSPPFAASGREVVLFKLGAELCAVDAFALVEVVPFCRLDRDPSREGAPGLLRLRGERIPLDNLSMTRGPGAESGKGVALIVSRAGGRHGFAVEELAGVGRLDASSLGPWMAWGGGEMSFQRALLDTGEGVALLSLEPHGIPRSDSRLPTMVPRVLFVDDADPARRVFEEVVAELGMEGWGCSGSAAGWAALQDWAARAKAGGSEVSTNLALILVDAEMPGQDGYALAKKILGDARFAGVRVALHSSLYSQANRAMGEAVGVGLYAPPFGKEALREFIEEQAGHGR